MNTATDRDVDRLLKRLDQTWVGGITKLAPSQPVVIDADGVPDPATIQTFTVDAGDVAADIERKLFNELWRSAATTVEQDGREYDITIEDAQARLDDAGYGDDQGDDSVVWLIHPETKRRIIDEQHWQRHPDYVGDYLGRISRFIKRDRALLLDTSALFRNPAADIASSIELSPTDQPTVSVRPPWLVRDENGLVAVELEVDDDE